MRQMERVRAALHSLTLELVCISAMTAENMRMECKEQARNGGDTIS